MARLELPRPKDGRAAHRMQEDAPSVTVETSTTDTPSGESTRTAASTAKRFLVAATVLLILGLILVSIAALQAAMPDLLSGTAQTSPGRLAPAGRTLLMNGWIITGLLGASLYAVARTTNTSLRRSAFANAALLLIVVGTLAGAVGIITGLQSGITGFEAPLWARAVVVVGFLLAAVSISATARAAHTDLGATGWYLTSGAWWLALSSTVSLVPPMSGVGGSVQTAFASASIVGLFVIISSVGLLYFAATTLTETDPSIHRPLGALGFWSLALVWGSMSATGLIFSPVPDWYETLGVGIAIAAFVPLLAIGTDLGLMLKGSVQKISDRGTLRYATMSFLTLALVTGVNLLLTYRSTSAVIQWTSFGQARDLLIVLGTGSFALFSVRTILRGGDRSKKRFHFGLSVAGLTGVVFGTIAGGVATGFSWAAGPASGSFANNGSAWEIAATTMKPFLWITAISLCLFTVVQVGLLVPRRRTDEDASGDEIGGALHYDLEFEGSAVAPSWKRLAWGAAFVWIAAALFTGVFPAIDPANADSTILGDEVRVYPAGSAELTGRNIYIAEGCNECHTQAVRPVGTDVGLGPVSFAGDHVHESPVLLGHLRVGPDLMHVASSDEFNAGWLKMHLTNPRMAREWSTMPSYSYLSDADLAALVSYIETLR